MTRTELVDRLVQGGIPDVAVAEKALRLTLAVLAEGLTDDEAQALASCLPDELARIVAESEQSAFDATELYARARRREETSPGQSREHVNVVLASLGAVLPDEVRRRLVRALPPPLGDQLVPPDLGDPPPYAEPRHAPALATLAGGRPGSRHPLAEARPSHGHTHSVAESDDPHAETKLSTATGLTQERLRDSLAEGRPAGAPRSVAEAKDD